MDSSLRNILNVGNFLVGGTSGTIAVAIGSFFRTGLECGPTPEQVEATRRMAAAIGMTLNTVPLPTAPLPGYIVALCSQSPAEVGLIFAVPSIILGVGGLMMLKSANTTA